MAEDTRPKKSFTVRTMEIGDLAGVHALGERVFQADLWPVLYRTWDEYEVTSLFNTDGDFCLVAENDSEDPAEPNLVGFVLGTVISKSGTAWSYGYILWLCAHPDWQRDGVASKLVDQLVATMVEQEGIRIMMSDTDPENPQAIGFFERKGFLSQTPHVYLSTNLEQNPLYSHLVVGPRTAARDKLIRSRLRRLAVGKRAETSVKKTTPKRTKRKGKKSKKGTR